MQYDVVLFAKAPQNIHALQH